MRKSRKSAADEAEQKGGRLLLHLEPGVRQAIEGDEVYFVEAKADDTEVRTRGARVLRDVRPMGVLAVGSAAAQGRRLGSHARPAGERGAAGEPERPRRTVGRVRGGLRWPASVP
jgi:hypothetical protein